MSLGIYPVFEPKLVGTKFHGLGEVLIANIDALEGIAESVGLMPLTAFADNRPIPDDFDGDPEELDEIMGEWTEWFEPSEGLAATQSLADYIKSNPEAAEQLDDPGEVVDELEEMVRVLGVAALEGIQFRLHMS